MTAPRPHPRGKEGLALFGKSLHNLTSVQAAALARECQAVPKREGASQQLQLAAREGKMCSEPSASHPDRQEGVCTSLAWTPSQSSHTPLG